jgi:hypothetical protein
VREPAEQLELAQPPAAEWWIREMAGEEEDAGSRTSRRDAQGPLSVSVTLLSFPATHERKRCASPERVVRVA